ncbi:hypothetical protein HS121_00850 [bacterium]|nr:hypothetical protein [bacterium]
MTLGGLTGLLNDFPGENTPALIARWDLGGQANLNELRVFSGNNGRDGRVFQHYDVYVTQAQPPTSGFTLLAEEVACAPFGSGNPAAPNDYVACLTSLKDSLGGPLASVVTGLEIHFYSVSNTARQFRDDWNAGNGDDRDDEAAAFESPLIFEVDAFYDPLCSTVSGLWISTMATCWRTRATTWCTVECGSADPVWNDHLVWNPGHQWSSGECDEFRAYPPLTDRDVPGDSSQWRRSGGEPVLAGAGSLYPPTRMISSDLPDIVHEQQ